MAWEGHVYKQEVNKSSPMGKKICEFINLLVHAEFMFGNSFRMNHVGFCRSVSHGQVFEVGPAN